MRTWSWLLAALPVLAIAPTANASTVQTVSGTVVQVATETPIHEGDHEGEHDHDATTSFLRTTDGGFTAFEGLDDVATGTDVTVELQGGNVVDVRQNRRATLKSTTTTQQSVKVAMMVPAGVTQDAKPFTTDQVRAGLAQASDYWSGQTAGQVSFSLSTLNDWTTSTRTCADFGGLWTDAAKATGFTSAPGEHLVVVLPKNAYTSGACAAYGMGSIGAGVNSAGYVYVTDVESSLWAHELGHNMGLGHANALSSASSPDVAWNGSTYPGATRVSYGNVWDVMSYSGATIGHGNVGIANQYRLGLLLQGITEVTETGRYTIGALPATSAGAYGLRIADPTTGTAYFVELRGTSTGDDLVASDARRPAKGVLVTKDDPAETNGTIALDGTPTGRAASDVNFTVSQGSTLSAASGKLHVTVDAVSATQATVTVTLGAKPAASPVTTAPAPVSAPTNGIAYSRDGVSLTVSGKLLEKYLATGGTAGTLGWPTSDQIAVKDGGLVQRFDKGLLYWTATTGAQTVGGAILGSWATMGWENSSLGFPTSGEITLRDGGIVQRFQNGLFYWTAATGAHPVSGAFGQKYANLGWENSALGFPTSGEIAINGGVLQFFTGGTQYWSPTTGAQIVKGALAGEWGRRGWENSHLGYPVTDEYPVAGGMQQRFVGGVLTWSSATGRVS